MVEPAVDTGTLEELIGRLAQGDDAALAALIRHTTLRLESLARYMLRG